MRRPYLALILFAACQRAAPTKPTVAAAPAGPRTMMVTTDVPLEVTVFGPDTAKATLVVITGGPGLSHHYALPLGTLASADVRVVFYDQRGVGKSGRPPVDAAHHTLALHVADLEAIRAALKADRIHVLGHSWGSMIAQQYAMAHADKVASLIILNGIPSNALPFVQGINNADTRITELVKQGLIPQNRPPSAPDGDCATVIPLLPAYNADPRRPAPPHYAQMTCHDLGDATFASIGMAWDYRPELAKLKLPTLVMTGDSDLFGVGWADDMAAAVPGAKKVIAPRCGHMMWDECPDALFPELRALLK